MRKRGRSLLFLSFHCFLLFPLLTSLVRYSTSSTCAPPSLRSIRKLMRSTPPIAGRSLRAQRSPCATRSRRSSRIPRALQSSSRRTRRTWTACAIPSSRRSRRTRCSRGSARACPHSSPSSTEPVPLLLSFPFPLSLLLSCPFPLHPLSHPSSLLISRSPSLPSLLLSLFLSLFCGVLMTAPTHLFIFGQFLFCMGLLLCPVLDCKV